MTEQTRTKRKKADPKVLTFFLLGFPTLLIIALAMISPAETWWAWILLALYQFIMLKQFIDRYYEVL
jgi:phosphatidylglycerophosphate synthase